MLRPYRESDRAIYEGRTRRLNLYTTDLIWEKLEECKKEGLFKSVNDLTNMLYIEYLDKLGKFDKE